MTLRLSSSSTTPRHDVKGITLKIALDSRGAAADLSADKSERFTCAESLDMVHRLRRDSDAVLVGRNTVQVDNPSLTVRRGVPCEKQPLRVVLDPFLKLIPNADDYTIFRDGLPTVIYHSVDDVDETMLNLEDSVTCVGMPDFNLSHIIEHLKSTFGVEHLMVEGGPSTARLFLPLLDRIVLVRAPLCFNEPLNSGISSQILKDHGFVCLGETQTGIDTVECWSRSHVAWPTASLSSWP